jgi:hypothetical protein
MKKTFLLLTATASLTMATLSAHAQFTVHSRPSVFARALVPSNLRQIPYKEWAPQGDPASPAQWHHTEFGSDDKQITFTVDTYANSEGKSIAKFFNDELVRRAQGGDHINYSVLKTDWYVISGTNNLGFEFYEKFFALPKVNITKNFEDYVPSYWVSFDFVYPYNQREKYDPMVATIAKGFDPGTETNFDVQNSP